MLRDVLRQLLSEITDIEVLDCPTGGGGIAEAAARTNADLVIAGERHAEPCAANSLLRRMPHTRALAVSRDGRSAVIYELRPHRHAIGELSADTLRAAVRGCAPPLEPACQKSTPRPAP